MSQLASMTIVNWGQFAKGLIDAKKKQLQFMRGELKRGANRIRKSFIQKQLQGPPGIKAGKLAKGKNIWTFVKGSSTDDLYAKIGISRILHVHEKGLTIHGRRRGDRLLFLREKGKIFAAVESVKIPARLKFEKQVHQEAPAALRKVAEAGSRGIEVALKSALAKSI